MSQQTTIKKNDGLLQKIIKKENGDTYEGLWDDNHFRKGIITFSNGKKWKWNNGIMIRIINS